MKKRGGFIVFRKKVRRRDRSPVKKVKIVVTMKEEKVNSLLRKRNITQANETDFPTLDKTSKRGLFG